tara:strand:+ start:1854 stop:3089 length:1236 start_codon:yes stop_codon:yes gene_type:complete
MTELSITPLRELCDNFKADIVDGPFGANLKREHYKNEGIPVLKIQNIKSFKITLKKMDYVDDEKYQELIRHSYRKGDIVMTKLGDPLGESAIVENIEDGLIVADLVRIRAQKVDTKYLCYHLNSPVTSAYINSQQKGTTRPRVRISVVRDLPIYTPPLAEQKRIVTIIDQAFADIEQARGKTEQNLKNARELFESYLQQVFSQPGEGWVETTLGNLSDINYGYTEKASFEDNGPHFLRITDIQNNDVNWEKVPYCPISKADYAKHKLETGDIVFARTGATTGKSYLLSNPPEAVAASYLIRLRVKSDALLPEFVKFFFQTKGYWDVVNAGMTGSAQGGFNASKLAAMEITYPECRDTQRVFVDKLSFIAQEIEQIISKYEKKLIVLEELKKSILQKAFSGELTKEKEGAVA